MKFLAKSFWLALSISVGSTLVAAPVIDPIPNASIPAGKSLIVPITAGSPNGRALTFTATSSTNRTGGPVFRYDDEFNTNALFTGYGQLALANSGKDTDGSQFFVTVAPYRFGDFGYTIFGQLVRGFTVLSNINNTAVDANSRPFANVIITRASLVPNTTDAVLTLTGTNLAGVSGTIKVIADDGAGGRTTNSFTATTIADTQNEPPILRSVPITNKFCPVNGRLTNFIAAFDMEGNAPAYGAAYLDTPSQTNSTNTTFNGSTGQLVIVPNAGYSGPLNLVLQTGVSSVTD